MHNNAHLKCWTASDCDNYLPLLRHVFSCPFPLCSCRFKEWKGTVSPLLLSTLSSLERIPIALKMLKLERWYSILSALLKCCICSWNATITTSLELTNIIEWRHLRSTYCVCIFTDGEVNMLFLNIHKCLFLMIWFAVKLAGDFIQWVHMNDSCDSRSSKRTMGHSRGHSNHNSMETVAHCNTHTHHLCGSLCWQPMHCASSVLVSECLL